MGGESHRTARPAAGGGPSAEELDRLRSRLVQAVQRSCPQWLAANAEDIVQVALLRVLEARGKGEGVEAVPSSYLAKAAYSAVVDEIRRHRRRREVAPSEEDAMDRNPAEVPDPEQTSVGRQLGQGLKDCMGGLVRPRRLAVTLYLQGHTVPEASRILGWTVKKSENLVYRGLADLRRCLEAKGMKP